MGRWGWLKSTKKLQEETYHYDHALMRQAHDRGHEMLTEHLSWNQVAAVQELAELREEFSWKPWATDAPFANRERIIAEIVDVNHFLGNILVTLDVSDEEYEAAYQKKQQINRDRAASGSYSAKKGGLAHGSD